MFTKNTNSPLQLIKNTNNIPSYVNTSTNTIDFAKYLKGTWKRNLEWREFGGTFQHVKTSNTIVVIEEIHKMDQLQEDCKYLKFSFGKQLQRQELKFGYEMKFSSNSSDPSITLIEWQYGGSSCLGRFFTQQNVAILEFILKSSLVTVTYRIMDENTVAICIVEVDEKAVPSIQYGNMQRMNNLETYVSTQ